LIWKERKWKEEKSELKGKDYYTWGKLGKLKIQVQPK
jgi:hypothetical protein